MRIGSLFTGTGALDVAVENVTGGRTVWRCDNDPAVVKLMAQRWPGDTNLGDVTKVDWSKVEPVDILAGGFPCQDVSAAGKRGGLVRYGAGNRSGLWAQMARAVDVLRPQLVVAENVRGLLSGKTDSYPDLLDCPACVADTEANPVRALGAVLGDLAHIGYDAGWVGVRASDVGAPHQRFRIFLIAWPAADTDRAGLAQRFGVGGDPVTQLPAAGGSDPNPAVTLLKTPTAQIAVNGGSQHPDKRKAGGHGPTLADEVEFLLLPTPDVGMGSRGTRDPDNAAAGRAVSTRDNRTDRQVTLNDAVATDWGIYEGAVRRWETLTRPAPPPTKPGPRGGNRLSAEFCEWLMGLPAGWVTDIDGLNRNQQLKALGNGVVPQQAEYALTYLLNAVGGS